MDLERLRDERVVSFLLRVMADPGESSEIRIHVLKRQRSGRLTADERSAVAARWVSSCCLTAASICN